jgi:hypothetical protein
VQVSGLGSVGDGRQAERAARLVKGLVAGLVGGPTVAVGVEVLAEVDQGGDAGGGDLDLAFGAPVEQQPSVAGVVKSGMNRRARSVKGSVTVIRSPGTGPPRVWYLRWGSAAQ